MNLWLLKVKQPQACVVVLSVGLIGGRWSFALTIGRRAPLSGDLVDAEQRRHAIQEAVGRWARERDAPESMVRKELADLRAYYDLARMDGEDFAWLDYRDEDDPLWWIPALADWAEAFGHAEVAKACEPYL